MLECVVFPFVKRAMATTLQHLSVETDDPRDPLARAKFMLFLLYCSHHHSLNTVMRAVDLPECDHDLEPGVWVKRAMTLGIKAQHKRSKGF